MGGAVFKDDDGKALTKRIAQTDVRSTLVWLETLTGLPLDGNTLGSTGLKPTSGDIDVAVDKNQTSKEDLIRRLVEWCKSHRLKPIDWIRKSGISVHFKTPINGMPSKGFVQTDFMFVDDIEYAKFRLSAFPGSTYSGEDRNILLASIAKAQDAILTPEYGLMSRSTKEVISKDPARIARYLLGRGATVDDLASVESILLRISNKRNRDELVKDAVDTFERKGIAFPAFGDLVESEETDDPDDYFLSRLRDRIVDRGYEAIFESVLLAEHAHIEHLEDMVFGLAHSASQAIDLLELAIRRPNLITVKFDGKPAILFGRDDQGFVLTDKAGFHAKSYNGMARAPADIIGIMSMRSGERGELIEMYQRIWPIIERVVPDDFRGFVQGDLLWTERLVPQNGVFTFMPNTVSYEISRSSILGRHIESSQVGIAIHTYYNGPNTPPIPWDQVNLLNQIPEAVILPTHMKHTPALQVPQPAFSRLRAQLEYNKHALNATFDPSVLRADRITDFVAQLKKYVNYCVRNDTLNQIGDDLIPWLQADVKLAAGKRTRMIQHVKENTVGMDAAFTLFKIITQTKTAIIRQLDAVSREIKASVAGEPGQEGYVLNRDNITVKLVDRTRFSAHNFARNNPL